MLLYLFSMVFGLFNTIFRGWVIKTFWAWFMLTQFNGLPSITTMGGVGLSFMISILTPLKIMKAAELAHANEEDMSAGVLVTNNIVHLVAIILILGTGWIAHKFM